MGGLGKEVLSLHELAEREKLTWGFCGRLCREKKVDIANYNNIYNKYLDVPSRLARYTLDLYEDIVEQEKGLRHWLGQYNSKKAFYDFINNIPKFMCQREGIKEVITILETAFEVYEIYQQELKDKFVTEDIALTELLAKINELNNRFFKAYLGFFIDMENVVKELQIYYLPPLTFKEIAAQISKGWIKYPYWTFDDFMNSITAEEKLIVLLYNLNGYILYKLDSKRWYECVGKYLRFIIIQLTEYNYEKFRKLIEVIEKIDEILKDKECGISIDTDYYKKTIYELESQYSIEYRNSMPVIEEMVMEFQVKTIELGFNSEVRF